MHLPIRAGVIRPVPFQKIDNTPHGKARRGVQRVLHVLDRHVFPVLEPDPFAEPERVGQRVAGNRAALGHGGLQIPVFVRLDKALENIKQDDPGVGRGGEVRVQMVRLGLHPVNERSSVPARFPDVCPAAEEEPDPPLQRSPGCGAETW